MNPILPAYKHVVERRFRETSGLYYEDFEPGDVFEHRPGRTILEADNTWFTLLTMNVQQVHFDAEYAAKSEWKKPLVNSAFTLALLTGMSVRTVSAKVVANLGWDKVKATAPVFAVDTLYADSKILSKRESNSRPAQGIVTIETRGFNQHGKVIMTFERTMLVYKRGHSPERGRQLLRILPESGQITCCSSANFARWAHVGVCRVRRAHCLFGSYEPPRPFGGGASRRRSALVPERASGRVCLPASSHIAGRGPVE
jgi:itaconyl-CoA hydratase